jgi:hypothetical protein
MVKGRVYRFKQRLLPARFVQKSHRAGFERPRPRVIVSMGGDENDRESRIGVHQVTLKIQPAHARHPHIENQAVRIVQPIRIQEFLG